MVDFKIREVKTKTGKTAVQVFIITQRKRRILKHLGSGSTPEEVDILKGQAEKWILNEHSDHSLFKNTFNEQEIFDREYVHVKTLNMFGYEFLEKLFITFNFNTCVSNLAKDLCIAQMLEPGSKRHLVRFLKEKIGIEHNLTNVYEWATRYDQSVKAKVEKAVLEIAKKEFNFDFSFVLYDVTTLYFESFKEYEFQRPGFSKDNKSNQPQIVIGLVVNREGFPVHHEVFKGNTFEGNTFLPIVLAFKELYSIENLTVVADAAMFSKLNFKELEDNNINYIIGARLANQKQDMLDVIWRDLKKTHKETLRLDNLIVEYSADRYKKDKREFEKQKIKALKYSNSLSTKLRKIKFLKNDKTTYFVDEDLVKKTERLLGVKGYVTNLTDRKDGEIIKYYHNLFKVEHAFRISKSDLETRPIYHRKEESIRNHILLCFMCLAMSVFLEIKSKLSKKEITRQLMSVTDVYLKTKTTEKIIKTRSELSTEAQSLLDLLH